ncbi:MAG: hypothetical protein HZC37_26115 [Burkholderiales bacterium]|nr:hypothetical protein [Burkholderiales bacterium]
MARTVRIGALTAVAGAGGLAACGSMPNMPLGPFGGSGASSTPPAAAAADTSPALPTAVQVVSLASEGLAGFFPFEGTSSTWTRADRRREESSIKGTGTVSRFLMSNTGSATITRLDRRLVYALDIPRAEYTECPLTGCPAPPAQQQPPRQQEPPRSTRDPGCTMRVASNTFNVKPTAQRKAINGFDTEQYAVDWSVAFEDPEKRRSTLQLTIDLWTTPGTPAMRDAMAMEAQYARAAAASVARAAVIPPQFMEMMNRYFAQSMSAADRTALFNIGRQMERVKGQPILTQLKLFYRGNACGGAAAEGGAGASPTSPTGVAGALSSLFGGGGSASGGAAGGAERPLLSFTQEVKSWRVEPTRDSQFAPPPQFKRTNPG